MENRRGEGGEENIDTTTSTKRVREGEEEKISKQNPDIVLVVNPSSSSGSTGKGWEDLSIKIKEAFGETPEVVFTGKAGDGTTLTREFLKKGFKKVVAIGGDGTLNEVANGFFFVEEEKKRRTKKCQ